MKSTNNNALWVSSTYQQEAIDTDWVKVQTQLTSSVAPSTYGYTNTGKLAIVDDPSNNFLVDSTDTPILYQPKPAPTYVFNKSAPVLGEVVQTLSTDYGLHALYFSPDESRMYTADATTDDIVEYVLATPGDLSTAVATGATIAESNPYGIAFDNSGTNLYVNRITNDYIMAYKLSTPWDLSTASYVTYYAYGATMATGYGVAVRHDGAYLYVGDAVSDFVREFTMPNPFSLTGVTYAGVLSHNTEFTGTIYGMQNINDEHLFVTDGYQIYCYDLPTNRLSDHIFRNKFDTNTSGNHFAFYISQNKTHIYIVDTTTKEIKKHNLDSFGNLDNPWESSANVAGSVWGIHASPDGSNLYLNSASTGTLHQTALSTPLDIHSRTGVLKELDVSANVGTLMYGFAFSPNGSNVYIIDGNADQIVQYTLSTPWDISTGTYTGVSTTGVPNNSYGIAFNPNGLTMYTSNALDEIVTHTLSTAWDITTLSGTTTSTSYADISSNIIGLAFSPNGSTLYLSESADNTIVRIKLSTPWDVSIGAFNNWTSIPTVYANNQTFNSYTSFTNDDEDIILVMNATRNRVETLHKKISFGEEYHYTISNTNPINNVYKVPPTFKVSAANSNTAVTVTTTSVPVVSSNTTHVVLNYNNDEDALYANNDPIKSSWDLQNMSFIKKSPDISPVGFSDLIFSDNGDRVFATRWAQDEIHRYTLTTPWDISSIGSEDQNIDTSSYEDNLRLLTFAKNGSNAYVYGLVSDNVTQVALTNPWDLSSIEHTNQKLATAPINAMTFSDDGKKFYTVDSADIVRTYDLPLAWNIALATSNSSIVYVGSNEPSPTDISFSHEGTRMYILGATNMTIQRYDLSIAWNVASATHTYAGASMLTLAAEEMPQAMHIKPDGSNVFVVGSTDTNQIYDFSLSASSTITGIEVLNGNTHLEAYYITPISDVQLPENTIIIDPVLFELNDANTFITSYSNAESISNTTVRNIGFGIIAEEGVEVTEARLNLWKAD